MAVRVRVTRRSFPAREIPETPFAEPVDNGQWALVPRPVSHHARTRTSFLLATVLTILVVTFNPMSSGKQLRSMLGIGQDLTFTITDNGSGDGFTFAATQPGSEQPVTWDRCDDIRYVVNPAGAPADQRQLVSDAVADIEAASGLGFRYDGTTDDRRFSDRASLLGPAPPVLVGWATSDEVSDLAGEVAGVGGAEATRTGPDELSYVTGMVVLDRDTFAAMAGRPDGTDLQRAVIEHELAHVVGLGHVDDTGELMYPETTRRTELGPGDRNGLEILGEGPCR
jgi:hypothetical protein